MKRVNPFAYVNSLRTFVDEVCAHLGAGEDVVVLAGPYGCDAIEDEVREHLVTVSTSVVLDSSRDLMSGTYRGLVLVRCLQEPYASFCDRCKALGLHFVLAPTGVSKNELGGYGLALTTKVESEAYRSMIIDLASHLCGGSVDCFKKIIDAYVSAEKKRRSVKNPLDTSLEAGAESMRSLCEERSYYGEHVKGFLSWLFQTSKGYFKNEADSQSTFLWAWSLRMCWRVDGVWHIDWSVLASAADEEDEFGFSANEQLRPACELLTDVAIRRVGIAANAAFMPVLERYCELAAARYSCGAMRHKDEGELVDTPSRSAQIGDLRVFSRDNLRSWENYVGRRVNMYEIKELRNHLCHLNPSEITVDMLEALKGAVLDLSMVGESPYTEASTYAFM